MSTVPNRLPHSVRLWQPAEAELSAKELLEANRPTRGVTSGMRLSEFFDRWYLPVVLKGNGASQSTIDGYRETIAWWVRLTGDPPLSSIDEFVMSDFQAALRIATFRKGPASPATLLALPTRAKHQRQLRAMFARTGPTLKPDRPAKGLLLRAPHLVLERARVKRPKPRFELDVARRIVAASPRCVKWGRIRNGILAPAAPQPIWWIALLSVLYYTGFRSGTVLLLRWRMIEPRRDGTWLVVPEECVPKTHKDRQKFLHPAALIALEQLRAASGAAGPDDLIFDWRRSYTHFTNCHERLQTLAGIAESEILEPQAWRRTHSYEMGRAGYQHAKQLSSHTLDHSDVATTEQYYSQIEPEAIRLLPPLLVSQRLLF